MPLYWRRMGKYKNRLYRNLYRGYRSKRKSWTRKKSYETCCASDKNEAENVLEQTTSSNWKYLRYFNHLSLNRYPNKMNSYKDKVNHNQDFNVKYRLYSPEEGGRKVTFQHLRCDFLYDGEDPVIDGIYMIHPEFLDGLGNPIQKDVIVPLEGYASMWIIVPETREEIHKHRIKVNTKGYFMEGARKIGEMQVTEVVDININKG